MDSRPVAARCVSVGRYMSCTCSLLCPSLCTSKLQSYPSINRAPRSTRRDETNQTLALGSETPHAECLPFPLCKYMYLNPSRLLVPLTQSYKQINKADSPQLFAKHSAVPIGGVQRAFLSLTNKPENGAFGTARVTAQQATWWCLLILECCTCTMKLNTQSSRYL